MRYQFFLIPAAIVAVAPAQAKIFMNEEQAQQVLFPGGRFTPQFLTLTESQARGISQKAKAPVHSRDVRAWRATTSDGSDGWFFLDQVEGKGDWISYAVALDGEGGVVGIEILECVADYDTITMPQWRAQFIGREAGDPMYDVETISGSTLSSRHITEGVRRILATHALISTPPSL